ncbi:MAG: 3-phosphoshikimate 1-carboxyvinyltransferase [Clostridiales bacterium]|nr:3-phosphoshikimate 1-carboxyvinyltransferase [Clostridiales bacterium]
MGVFELIKVIEKSFLGGKISSIPSKSYAHRIAICNFLAGNLPSACCKDFTSNDMAVTESCLNALKNGEKVLDCGESGSTLRFLLPLAGVIGGEYEFIGHGKLMERPNDELFSVLESHGVTVKKGSTILISGKLTSGKFELRGDISSQYISGLLMALPILKGDSEIVLTTPLSSAPYVEITLEVLKNFGVTIDKTENGYKIKGGQTYLGYLIPEGDWSNSAFFLVAGAINGDITVTGLNPDSVQGDRAIIEILKSAGANLKMEKDGISVRKSELNAFTFDAKDCPDLVPIVAVLGAYANGKSIIKNIERLKIKESDRIVSTISMLNAFNIKAESDGKNLTVYGGEVTGGIADSFNDHRIAMSTAILAIKAKGQSTIIGAEAVKKSYPTFFDDFVKLGGGINEHS